MNIRKNRDKLKLIFDRSFSSGLTKQLIWLLAIMLLIYGLLLGLSYLFNSYSSADSGNSRWYDILYLLIDPGSGSESIAPAFAVVIALLGLVVFGGMLISVMSNVLERRVESYTNGETDYNISDHVVVIGFNSSISSLIKKIHEDYPDAYILIMSEKSSEDIRDLLRSCLEDEVEKYIIVLHGIQTAKDDIKRLSLTRNPRELYVLGEEDDVCHDANNLECVKLISEHLIDNNDRVVCHVQIDSTTTYAVLQRVDFCKENGICSKLVFQPFNFNEIWSQKILATANDGDYLPLDGDGITSDSPKHVHLIIAGTNAMAASIAVNAAHILHFPNFKDGDFSTCSHITFIEKDIHDFAKSFRLRYRNLFELARWREVDGDMCNYKEVAWIDALAAEDSKYRHLGEVNFMDIQWEFISGDICDDNVLEYLINCAEQKDEITTIALCSDCSEQNASICMALPDEIYQGAHQVLVQQKESSTTIDLLEKLPSRKDKVKAFGLLTECYRENLVSDKYGKLINALYCRISDFDDEAKIQEAWDGCSILDKWSSIYCANMLFPKLRSLGLPDNYTREHLETALANSNVQDEIQRTEHNRWNTERLLLGFSFLTQEEQSEFRTKEFVADKEGFKKKKKGLAAEQMKHLDICSNEMLQVVDPSVCSYDTVLNSKLWELRQIVQDSKTSEQ